MTNPIDNWKKVQAALGTTQDGIPGPKDIAAWNKLKAEATWAPRSSVTTPAAAPSAPSTPQPQRTLTGRGLTLIVEGDDLLLKNVRVTCFGGANDPQDSGDTASGVSTKPIGTLGCALPRNYEGTHAPTRRALMGSPIPESLPFKTPVRFTNLEDGVNITVPFIDLGPDLNTGNAGDLTVAAAKHFNPLATASNFEMRADIRIIGGAKYL